VVARPHRDGEEVDAPGEVDDVIPGPRVLREQPIEIRGGHALAHEAHALRQPGPQRRPLGEFDHRNARARHAQMADEERQQRLRDDAETGDEDFSGVARHLDSASNAATAESILFDRIALART
jgi:hypothetical protein